MFVNRKADLNILDESQNSILHIAVKNHDFETVEILLEFDDIILLVY